MTLVLDVSVTLPWFFEDVDDPYAMSLLDSLREAQAMAPVPWAPEIAND